MRASCAGQLAFCLLTLSVVNGCSERKRDDLNLNTQSSKTSPAVASGMEIPKSAPSKPEQLPDSKHDATIQTKRKSEKVRPEKEKKALRVEDEQKRQAKQAIRNATNLQAPPLEKGKNFVNFDDMAKTMRDLAGNEFKFQEAKSTVFRSTFNQKDVESSPLIKVFFARNALLSPGSYDFNTGYYDLDLVFWQYIREEWKTDPFFPRIEDACRLRARISVDAKIAKRWRDAIDSRTFKLTIWYHLAKVEQATWKQTPYLPDSRLAHDIIVRVEVIKFE